jgi:acyl-CoA synthetase (AMP-forming)/AMP-acid ligase II
MPVMLVGFEVLSIVDRKKYMIIVSGCNVFANEIVELGAPVDLVTCNYAFKI